MSNTVDVNLTDAACAQMTRALNEAGKKAVRFAVREAGCSGFEYVMDYADVPEAGDLVRHFDGFDLFVDADSYDKALTGLTVDYQQDLLSSGFVFINPNKKGECGCGASFSV
jgi:iron-sulfur cluster assembly protein